MRRWPPSRRPAAFTATPMQRSGARPGRIALGDQFTLFLHHEAAGAVVLLAATVAAVAIANSPLAAGYDAFLHTDIGVSFGNLRFAQSIKHWVDDTLMALFFFVVGLEIKREVIVGELSSLRGALLPICAALGGMLAPAAVYLAFNAGGPGAAGWGVPMATDIAFALGVLALLGPRVPAGLKVFLAALAIADDIGAILVIAVFYTAEVRWVWLGFALLPLAALVSMNRRRVEEPLPYLAVGGAVVRVPLVGHPRDDRGRDRGVHDPGGGPHPPARVHRDLPGQARADRGDRRAGRAHPGGRPPAGARARDPGVRAAQRRPAPAPPARLLPLSTFVVLPAFALANAGIPLGGADPGSAVAQGIFLGLVAGKFAGVLLAAWLAVRTGIADLPAGVGWRHVAGAGALAGIGFTMSLFVANLAFESALVSAQAKSAIFAASIVAGVLGFAVLRFRAPGGARA